LQNKSPCVGKRRQGGREEIHRTVLSVEFLGDMRVRGSAQGRTRRRADYSIVTP
jgi:hypothetical protein